MSKSPIRVAIVDDEASVRTALARLLSASSFEPQTYGTAREFIDFIRTDVPECLVVDVHMPDFTGLDLQRYLNRINKKIPTVVITAFDDAGVRERSTASGAKAFLTKPLHGPTLIEAILQRDGKSAAGRVAGEGSEPEEKEILVVLAAAARVEFERKQGGADHEARRAAADQESIG